MPRLTHLPTTTMHLAYRAATITRKMFSNAYQLQLPETMKCHVFHISRLQPCTSPTEQPDFIPTSVEANREEYSVDHIVDHQISQPRNGF